jgi:hypothetical protein
LDEEPDVAYLSFLFRKKLGADMVVASGRAMSDGKY